MAALTNATVERIRTIKILEGIGIAANAVIHQNAYVVVNAAGYLAPATSATGLKPLGLAAESYDNTGGANGAIRGAVDLIRERSARGFLNDPANAVASTDIGKVNAAFLLDDQTVTAQSTGRTALPGMILDVTGADSDHGAAVWVEI